MNMKKSDDAYRTKTKKVLFGMNGTDGLLFSILGYGLLISMGFVFLLPILNMIAASFKPEEAARLDGARNLTVFLKVAMPTVAPALIVTVIFSLVWYWNETYTTKMFLAVNFSTLPLELSGFKSSFDKVFQSAGEEEKRLNEEILMAATLLTILPMIFIYFVM